MISFCPMKIDRIAGMTLNDAHEPSILEIDDMPGLLSMTDIKYKLHLSVVNESVLVKGSVSITLEVECGRCLDKYKFVIEDKDVCHFYDGAAEKSHLNITEEIREDLLVKLPQYFICREECEGLCQYCGVKKSKCKCDGAEKAAAMIFEEEEVESSNPWEALDSLNKKPAKKQAAPAAKKASAKPAPKAKMPAEKAGKKPVKKKTAAPKKKKD